MLLHLKLKKFSDPSGSLSVPLPEGSGSKTPIPGSPVPQWWKSGDAVPNQLLQPSGSLIANVGLGTRTPIETNTVLDAVQLANLDSKLRAIPTTPIHNPVELEAADVNENLTEVWQKATTPPSPAISLGEDSTPSRTGRGSSPTGGRSESGPFHPTPPLTSQTSSPLLRYNNDDDDMEILDNVDNDDPLPKITPNLSLKIKNINIYNPIYKNIKSDCVQGAADIESIKSELSLCLDGEGEEYEPCKITEANEYLESLEDINDFFDFLDFANTIYLF
jgi:hypothetical protein